MIDVPKSTSQRTNGSYQNRTDHRRNEPRSPKPDADTGNDNQQPNRQQSSKGTDRCQEKLGQNRQPTDRNRVLQR